MTITLTPTEITDLTHAVTRVSDLADRSPNIAAALGIDQRARKNLRLLAQKIRAQAAAQTYKSNIPVLTTDRL